MKAAADLLVVRAGQLLTLQGPNDTPRTGSSLREVGLITDGALAAADGVIIAAGSSEQVLDEVVLAPDGLQLDVRDRVVLPGFVDAHTHLIHAGSRVDEFEQRLGGATYQEIAAKGGGILSTMRATREASEDELVALGHTRLDRMLRLGTTTIEAKSGYGLRTEDELKCLRAMHRLGATHEVDIVTTFLGAHVVAPEFAGDADGYVRLIVEEMIPAVLDEDFAEFCDVFCEGGAFTLEQSRVILEAGADAGLAPKIHADQLSDLGGALLAAEVGAVSADHLEYASDLGLQAMAEAGTVAVLLPGTAFYLGVPYARARRMIDLAVPVALATDFNPGTSPTCSMPMVVALGCIGMRLLPSEAITAATINAAHAIGMAEEVGSLEPGKAADLVVLDVADYRELATGFGTNPIAAVIKRGRVVWQAASQGG